MTVGKVICLGLIAAQLVTQMSAAIAEFRSRRPTKESHEHD